MCKHELFGSSLEDVEGIHYLFEARFLFVRVNAAAVEILHATWSPRKRIHFSMLEPGLDWFPLSGFVSIFLQEAWNADHDVARGLSRVWNSDKVQNLRARNALLNIDAGRL